MNAEVQSNPPKPEGLFERAADFLSQAIGTPVAFAIAVTIVFVWALAGPWAGFSNTWQLIVNTGTTIATFLMVFLLANASNRLTENQDQMLEGIFGEEHQLEQEEALIRKLMERIDVRHIRPILKHLDEQDHQVEAVAERILAELRAQATGAS